MWRIVASEGCRKVKPDGLQYLGHEKSYGSETLTADNCVYSVMLATRYLLLIPNLAVITVVALVSIAGPLYYRRYSLPSLNHHQPHQQRKTLKLSQHSDIATLHRGSGIVCTPAWT